MKTILRRRNKYLEGHKKHLGQVTAKTKTSTMLINKLSAFDSIKSTDNIHDVK